MKIKMRGTTWDGDDFEQVHAFDSVSEVPRFLHEVHRIGGYFDIWFSTDVNAADAETAMALAIGSAWKDGVCRTDLGAITRLTGSGGRA